MPSVLAGAPAGRAPVVAPTSRGSAPNVNPKPIPQAKVTVKAPAPPTGGNGPATRTSAGASPFAGVIMSPKQMVAQATKQVAGIYNPVLANINAEQTAANGLASKRSADAAAFQQWITQQTGALTAAAGARADSLNSLLGQVSTNAAAPQPANAGLTSTVSNLANSNTVGSTPSAGGTSTLGVNQQAANQATQGAVTSAALSGADNASMVNATPTISANIGANYLGEINAALQSTTTQLSTEKATALGQQASDKEKLIGSLQTMNASNIKSAADYGLKEQTLQQTNQHWTNQLIAQANHYAQTNALGVQRNRITYNHDQQLVSQAKSTQRQKGAEFLATNTSKQVNQVEALAQQLGYYTPAMKEQINSLMGTPVFTQGGVSSTVTGATSRSEIQARQAATDQAAYRDVTSRLNALNAQKKTSNDLTLGLLRTQIESAATNAKVSVSNAEIKRYAAETQQSYATAKSDIIKAIAYSKAQGASANHSNAEARNQNAEATGTGGYAGRYAGSKTTGGIKPMTTDSLATYDKNIADAITFLHTAMTKGITTGTGKNAKTSKPLNYQQLRDYLVSNKGKGDAPVWAAFDLATAGGLTQRTAQMLEAAGYPSATLQAKYKILPAQTLAGNTPTAGRTGSPGIPPTIAGG